MNEEQSIEFLKILEAQIAVNMNRPDFYIQDFCAVTGLSRTTIHRRMIETTGLAFTDYLRKRRLEAALTLLKSGQQNISEIALAVGFKDPNYFSRAFKQHFGKTPSEMRFEQ